MEAIKQQDKPEASGSHPQPLASTDLAKPKKVKPPHCFRCKCNGHLADCCKADLDCFICNKKNAHISAKRPLVKLPKPTASMLVLQRMSWVFSTYQILSTNCPKTFSYCFDKGYPGEN